MTDYNITTHTHHGHGSTYTKDVADSFILHALYSTLDLKVMCCSTRHTKKLISLELHQTKYLHQTTSITKIVLQTVYNNCDKKITGTNREIEDLPALMGIFYDSHNRHISKTRRLMEKLETNFINITHRTRRYIVLINNIVGVHDEACYSLPTKK